MKWFVAASILLASTSGSAQQTDTSVFHIGEIVVQAARPVTTTGGASAIELRLDSLRTQAAPTLDQVLRQTPLVQVRVNSRGESQFSLRGSGSDARQVAIVVDGIPINLGWDHRADLSVLPATAPQSLTLSRGLPSLLYGPNVLGGVVEIGVARGSAVLNPRGVRFDVSADQTGGTGVAGAITVPIEQPNRRWLFRAGLGHRQRDGYVRPDDIEEEIATGDELRLNTDLRHFDAFASASYRPDSGFWVDGSISGYRAERGIAPEMHVTSPRFWRYPEVTRMLGVIAAGTGMRRSPLGGKGDVEMSIGLDAGRTEIDQYTTSAFTTINNEEDSDDRNITLRLRADQSIAKNGEVRAGLTYSDLNHDEVLTPGASASYRQKMWSGGLELHWDVPTLGKRTKLSAGAAIDGASTPESGDKPPLGDLSAFAGRLGFSAMLSEQVLLHAGASVRSRFPALRELYSGALGRFEPNPELHPERLKALEIGTTLSTATAELQVVAFHHVLDDAIVRISVPDRRFKRVNRDEQSGTGIELMAGARLGRFSVSGDAVIQRTKLEDATTGMATTPEYQPDFLAGIGLAGPLPASARFDLRAKHTGRQVCINPDSGAEVGLPAVERYDAEISRGWRMQRAWTSAIELAIGADNLTDQAIYDQCGLPQAGRTFRIQLRVR